MRSVKNKNKTKILAVASAFGLGPVGKLCSIVAASNKKYDWYATGPAFDLQVFRATPFKDVLFSEDEGEIRKFVIENNIKFAVVVLKNKVARFLKSIGVKVLYVDSLPFMWTQADFNAGKVPVNMDFYCAQKSLPLDEQHLKMFDKVQNLKWVGPIISKQKLDRIKENNAVVINLGGLHSTVGNGMNYVEVVARPLIEKLQNRYKNSKIYVTCGQKSQAAVKKCLNNSKIVVCTLAQNRFLNLVKKSALFFTSPGLTTILEVATLGAKINLLPPQNLSQFYNAQCVPKYYKEYKILSWDDEILNLNYLSSLDGLESEIVTKIYDRISTLNTDTGFIQKFNCKIDAFLDADFVCSTPEEITNGTKQILEYLNLMIKGDKNAN